MQLIYGNNALLCNQQLTSSKTILPPDIAIFPVGGINLSNMKEYLQAGTTGFGLGSALYQPGDSPEKVVTIARAFYDAVR